MRNSCRQTFKALKFQYRVYTCCSVKTDLMEEGANSTLSIAKVGPMDSGNYTCQLTTMPDQPATVHVHVLNGENIFVFLIFLFLILLFCAIAFIVEACEINDVVI